MLSSISCFTRSSSMANSLAALSRVISRSLLSKAKLSHNFRCFSTPFYSSNTSSVEDTDSDESNIFSELDSAEHHPSSSFASSPYKVRQRVVYDRQLEDGLEVGIYKAIIVGQVGQSPLQKKLRTGRTVTLFSVGTGGIRNNRRPMDNEEPREYANRSAVQWHRVSIYPEKLGNMAMKHVLPGSILYLEGNLETKIFTDAITGLVRRIREISIRANGRLVFLGKGSEATPQVQKELQSVGYY